MGKTIFDMDPFTFVYAGISWVTFVYAMFFDGIVYTWWNWPIAIGTSAFFAALWPVYWIMEIFL